jgi:hypothetical protein
MSAFASRCAEGPPFTLPPFGQGREKGAAEYFAATPKTGIAWSHADSARESKVR